jgi:hypothetical protein
MKGMQIKPGRKIALAVHREWYQSIATHKFLKEEQPPDHPTDVFQGTIEDLESPQGIWVKVDERYSHFPLGSLFVPWSAIVAAMLLGPDDDIRLGFAP